MSKTCGEALVELLQAYGVSMVFGIPGEHTLELYRGIEKGGLHAITPRNEQGASFMADGYARVTGKPGVCTLITGPGVTNAATAIGQAYADSIPMLVISSANDSPSLGKGWGRLHETRDLCAITAPITAFSVMVTDPAEIPELLGRAWAVFESGRPRPVHIAIPIDLLELPVDDAWHALTPPPRPLADPESITAAADFLEIAKRPILIVGGGAQDAGPIVTQLAELLDAAVISSNAGKGIVPDSNPLSLTGGVISPPAQDYLSRADVVLAIGTEIGEADSFIYDLPLRGELIRIDIDPQRFGDAFPAAVPVLGDAGDACRALLAALRERDHRPPARNAAAEVAAVKVAQQEGYTEVQRQHVVVLKLLRECLPVDAVIMGDIAQLVYTGTEFMPMEQPRCWFYPAGFGTLGCALPGAIGAQLAEPDRAVVALAGDGGLMFTINELATAVEERLPIPIVVWHNHSYAMIRDGMVKRGIGEIGVNPRAPDFVKLAEAFGCPGSVVRDADEFRDSLAAALRYPGPSLIIVNEDDDWLVTED